MTPLRFSRDGVIFCPEKGEIALLLQVLELRAVN